MKKAIVWVSVCSLFSCFDLLFDCTEEASGTDAAAERMISNELGGARGIVRSV